MSNKKEVGLGSDMRGLLKLLVDGKRSPLVDKAKVLYDRIPLRWRYGRDYVKWEALFKKSEYWSLEDLIEYQTIELKALIDHCYKHVPFYKKQFRELGLIPSDINSEADLPLIPYITKQNIRKHKADLIADNFPIWHQDPDVTSGSTGNPLNFFVDKRTRAMEIALAYRHLYWLGYQKGDPVVEIKEDLFFDPDKIVQYYPGSNQLRFSFFKADNQKIATVVKLIADFKPKYIKAFPSSLKIISLWMNRNNVHIEPPLYLITSSENLYDSTINEAEKAFGAPVVDFYGQNEKVGTAIQCKQRDGYHIQMEQAVVEYIPVNEDFKEIVGTSLSAYGMPFIRYRTGDYAKLHQGPCSCGRHHLMLSDIIGRESEFLYSPERAIITPVAMDYAFYGLEEIKQAQIEQVSIDKINIKLVPWEMLSDITLDKLLENVRFYMNSDKLNISVEIVDEIERTSRGKRQFIINHLHLDDCVKDL